MWGLTAAEVRAYGMCSASGTYHLEVAIAIGKTSTSGTASFNASAKGLVALSVRYGASVAATASAMPRSVKEKLSDDTLIVARGRRMVGRELKTMCCDYTTESEPPTPNDAGGSPLLQVERIGPSRTIKNRSEHEPSNSGPVSTTAMRLLVLLAPPL
jgi:hypothetical protein